MKKVFQLLFIAAALSFSSCGGESHDHDHEGHDHDSHEGHDHN